MAMREDAQNVCKPPLPNIVPSILVSSIQGTEPKDMALRDCNNNLWHLKIEKFGDNWYFTDGWVKFVEDNMIKGGDVLFYQYSSQGLLDFKILDTSDREDDRIEHLENRAIIWRDEKIEVKVEHEEVADYIDKNPPNEQYYHPQKEKMVDDEDVDDIYDNHQLYDHPWKEKIVDDEDVDDIDNNSPKKRRRYGHPQKEKVLDDRDADDIDDNPPKELDDLPQKEKVVEAGAIVKVRGKRRKKQDYYGTELFASGEISQPMNPYFVVQARETRVNEMYIPTDLVKCYNLEFPSVLVLADPLGREFLTKRTSWRDGRVIYRGGWRALCRVNLAGKDDKLICEFIREEGRDLHLKVSFFRAK